MDSSAVARFTGSRPILINVILGLAPQALCFRPLRGLSPELRGLLAVTKPRQFIETIASFVV